MKYTPDQANALSLEEIFNLYSLIEMEDDMQMAMEKYMESKYK